MASTAATKVTSTPSGALPRAPELPLTAGTR